MQSNTTVNTSKAPRWTCGDSACVCTRWFRALFPSWAAHTQRFAPQCIVLYCTRPPCRLSVVTCWRACSRCSQASACASRRFVHTRGSVRAPAISPCPFALLRVCLTNHQCVHVLSLLLRLLPRRLHAHPPRAYALPV